MQRKKVIKVPIYTTEVHVLIGDALAWMKWNVEYKLGLEGDDYGSFAFTIQDNKEWIVCCLLKPDKLDYNTLCHEFIHVMDYICDMHDIKSDPDNNEAVAYLAGYVGKQFFQFREKVLGLRKN